MIEKTLQKLGLNEKEIKAYLTLLALGSVPASIIAKRANIERSHTIYICKSLVKKGFVNYIEKNNAFIFTASPPKELFRLIEKERKELKQKETQLHGIIGALENMIHPATTLPKIQFFEGVDGMISIYKDMLKENEDIYDCNMVDRSFMHPDFINYWINEYMPQREKMKNRSFSLYNRESGFDEYTQWDEKVRRITLFLPKDKFPFRSQILIYGKKIAFCSLDASDLMGVIIENEAILETQFSLFSLAWNHAKTLPQNKKYKDVVI